MFQGKHQKEQLFVLQAIFAASKILSVTLSSCFSAVKTMNKWM